MNLNTNLVIVTGAAGWLGINLVDTLLNGLEDCLPFANPNSELKIRCLVLPNQDASSLQNLANAENRLEIVRGDVRNPTDCQKLFNASEGAIAFHTAGIIHPNKISDFHDVNVEGTKNLLNAATKSQVKRMVIVSSNSPCGCNPHPDHLFDESSPYHPYMNYGRSKMLMELAIQAHQSQTDLETVIIRTPWFYGPYQPPRQTLFFQMIRDGKAPIVGDGNNLRSMAYTGNLVQGLLLAAIIPDLSGKIYWIADARPYAMNEVVDTVERLLESEFGQVCLHKRLRLPNLASEIALAIDAGLQKLNLYNQKIHVLSEMNKTIACSIQTARKELGYNPSTDLKAGMRKSIQWLLAQNPQALN